MTPPRITTRAQWDADYGTGALDPGPEGRVVIHHSYRPALATNATPAQEISAWRGIERYHVTTNGWDGIGYNFGVAPSGRIYEGRGWKYRGAHAGPVNGDSIGICLLIDGTVDEPTPAMIEAVQELIAHGIDLGEIRENYTLSGHRDHMARTCPGDKVYARLSEFRHDDDELEDLPEPHVALAESLTRPTLPLTDPVVMLERPAREFVAEMAQPDDTTSDFLCRSLGWLTDQPEITGRLPSWVPSSAPKWLLGKLLGCAIVLALLPIGIPAQENRVGWCYLNMGQLVEEPDYHVRAGNMGNENACAFADFDIGSGFYAGGMVAYTKMFIWPRGEEDISRWSWRPSGGRETAFAWIHPQVGYVQDLWVFELRPNVGIWWPAGTSYNWGAPVGIAFSGGLEVGVHIWRFEASLKGWYIRKGEQGWTVLHDWATEGPIEREVSHIWPVALGLSLWH